MKLKYSSEEKKKRLNENQNGNQNILLVYVIMAESFLNIWSVNE